MSEFLGAEFVMEILKAAVDILATDVLPCLIRSLRQIMCGFLGVEFIMEILQAAADILATDSLPYLYHGFSCLFLGFKACMDLTVTCR